MNNNPEHIFGHLESTHGTLEFVDSPIPNYLIEKKILGRYSSRCTYLKWAHNIWLHFDFRKFQSTQPQHFKLGGTTNLYCVRYRQIDNILIYKAAWLKDGKGYSKKVLEGLILESEGVTYHVEKGKSLKRAIKNLRTKIARQKIIETVPAFGNLKFKFSTIKDLLIAIDRGEITDFDHLRVYRTHSIKAGNCIPGTDEFIDVHGIDTKTGINLRDFCNQRKLDHKYLTEKLITIGETIKRGYQTGKINLESLKRFQAAFL